MKIWNYTIPLSFHVLIREMVESTLGLEMEVPIHARIMLCFYKYSGCVESFPRHRHSYLPKNVGKTILLIG